MLMRKNRKIPAQKKHALRMAIGILTAASCLTAALVAVPGETWLSLGQSLAMLSAGMQQPEGGAVALSERFEHRHAGGSTTTSGPPGTTGSTAGGTGEQDLPADETTATKPIPPRAGDGGDIVEQMLTTGSSFVEGVAIKNISGVAIDIAEQLGIAPDLGLTDTSEPQVLIVHTHTTEGYMSYDAGYYNADDITRTTDMQYNVAAVGEAIAGQLRAAGIGVIHDTTIHDSPYTGAYDRSAATVQKNLEPYPPIRVVLDIHRDAINSDATTKVKPTVTINGRKAAQMMIITGAVSTEALPHPNWRENLRLALRLQQLGSTTYEGLMRPMTVGTARYNAQLTNGSMLIEVGTEANTLDEAKYSGQLLGELLGKVLNSLKT